MKLNKLSGIVILITSFGLGVITAYSFSLIKASLGSSAILWDSSSKNWGDGFSVVTICSSLDDNKQKAYFGSAESNRPEPLLVSLHTWSGDFSQEDPLAHMAKQAGWNYIHPDFRGANRTQDACLSEKAITDIDDAIQYAIENGNVDLDNIFVVGMSGGGYAVLGAYLKTRHTVNAFLAWCPISDLTAWYYQSLQRNPKYARDILRCTSNGPVLDIKEAKSRSPLFWQFPEKLNGRLEIYAGIHDGHTGSVPISHSIEFFNRLAAHSGRVENMVAHQDFVALLTYGINEETTYGFIGKRRIFFKSDISNASLIVFDGGHEMLSDYCFKRLQTLTGENTVGIKR
jgi:pimeloyl-ACP methyl ester carboxylesterase